MNKQQQLKELLKKAQRMKAVKDGGPTAGLIYDLIGKMGELKGDKGDTGGIGPTPRIGIDYMTEKEIDHFVNKVFSLIKVPKDGKNADEKKMIEEILRRIPKPKDGRNAKDVDEIKIIKEILKKIKIPKDGMNGIDGDDGSPDTPKQIVNKINTLDKVIDAKVIKNLPTVVERRMIPEITLFGGQGRGRTKVQDISAGAGIAITKSAGGVYKITSTGELENLWDRVGTTISPHISGDTLDMTGGVIIAGDHGLATKPEAINIVYGESDPPDAATVTEGALFIKYTN